MADTVRQDLLRAIERDALFLPTLPEVALRIRQAAEDSDISVAELAKVIGSDTALSARLIKVVNSPLLRATFEVSDVLSAVRRLGVNYTCNLAVGLVVEQMFHARSDVIEKKMRDIWQLGLQVAGVANALSFRITSLAPDKATLAGLVHLIGILPILTYAEEHFELLADPVSLNHVIESIHPIIGERLLRSWDFPDALAIVPTQYQQFDRQVRQPDYVDLVQVATLHVHQANGQSMNVDLTTLPAAGRLKLDLQDAALIDELNQAMFSFS